MWPVESVDISKSLALGGISTRDKSPLATAELDQLSPVA